MRELCARFARLGQRDPNSANEDVDVVTQDRYLQMTASGLGSVKVLGPQIGSIHKLAREIRRLDHSLYNHVMSIIDDSRFIQEVRSRSYCAACQASQQTPEGLVLDLGAVL